MGDCYDRADYDSEDPMNFQPDADNRTGGLWELIEYEASFLKMMARKKNEKR